METLKFKTNIKCGGCIATVTPFLEKTENIKSWNVDTNSPDKVLTVAGDIDAPEVVAILAKAGFQAETL